MSSNLRNKQFVIRNKQYNRESYAGEVKKIFIGMGSVIQEFKNEHRELMRRSLHKFASIRKSTGCSGDNINNSKNAIYCFDSYEDENAKWSSRLSYSSDAYDVFGGGKAELICEVLMAGYDSYNTWFASFGDAMAECQYVDSCHNSSSLFGSIALGKKQFCILNKQYTETEYKALVPKIIAQMSEMPYTDKKGRAYRYGEFFPIEISPFAYNETIAGEYFPLTKEEAEERGYAWRDPDPSPYTPTMAAKDVPDDVAETPDSITNEIISCAQCGKVYRILPQELQFLKHHGIALPRACERCRHEARFKLRNPLKLWHRRCMCQVSSVKHQEGEYKNTAAHFHGNSPCPNEFETSYAPERPEIIYCEQCYNAEVA